ncbi:hypothetical protein [Hydrogenobacter hydrogenophilus]|uniref:Cytochrome C and Quinol oxidase polypeptide I n=1 Tax=Hydrogenobacter hydrogenophilus TaxID=35835 RepID=A0A285P220_9AQUI|nr:hypothetical protein [Hydrogenobacter hydrogenophilus]SNZ15775.1 hypothetical protein SAMN06265353_1444 [Hydrogenobacter hydrogenophilus]
MTGLSLQQAPPFIIVFGFFLTACSFGVILSIAEFYMALRHALYLPALVHLYTLGFALFTMFGALFQMLPVVAGAVIKNPKPKALISYLLLISGIPTFVYSFIFGRFMLLGALLTYAGILYTSLLMLYHLFKIKSFTPTPKGMKFSLVFLLLGATAGLYRVLSYYGYLPTWEKVLDLHYTLLLFGWIGLLISAVSFQVVEMFFVAKGYPKHFSENFPLLVSLSIFLSIMGNFFSLLLLFLFFAYSFLTLKGLIARKRKIKDYTLYFWYLGQISLVISLVLFGFKEGFFIPFLFFYAVFFTSIIMGMMYRIIPFLVWFHSSNEGRKDVPLMSEVIPPERIKISFYLHSAWVLMTVLIYLLGEGYLLASVIHLISSLFLLYNIYKGGILYFKTQP